MARKENSGPVPDLSFIEKVRVYNESDRDDLRDYLMRNLEAVEPLRWAVSNWGAEKILIEWFGEGWEEVKADYPGGLPVFYVTPRTGTVLSSEEKGGMIQDFRGRFPECGQHMRLSP